MPLVTKRLGLNNLTADPGSLADGQVWYRSDLDEFRGRANGVTVTFFTAAEAAAYLLRDGTNAMTGALDFGSNKGVNLTAPAAAGDAAEFQWVLDQITSKLGGLDWQESVIDKDLSKPPGAPATGDRYIVAYESHAITAVNTGTEEFQIAGDQTAKLSAGEVFTVHSSTGNDQQWTIDTIGFTTQTNIVVTGDITDGTVDGTIVFAEDEWNGKLDYIEEWDGAAWVDSIPNEGFTTRVMDENKFYTHDGSAATPTTGWGPFSSVVDHGALIGLGDDDHTQYILADGSRSFSGNVNMGTNNITNVGTVDGVTVSNHSARHDPGGADALTTAAAVAVGAANAEGSAASFARSDHTHEVTNLKLASEAQGAIAYRNATVWVVLAPGTAGQHLETGGAGANPTWETAGGGATVKAGLKAVGAFAGNPKTVTVTFATAFGDNLYAISVALECQNNATYTYMVHTKSATAFTIEIGSDDVTDLLNAFWIATPNADP